MIAISALAFFLVPPAPPFDGLRQFEFGDSRFVTYRPRGLRWVSAALYFQADTSTTCFYSGPHLESIRKRLAERVLKIQVSCVPRVGGLEAVAIHFDGETIVSLQESSDAFRSERLLSLGLAAGVFAAGMIGLVLYFRRTRNGLS